MRNQYKRQKKKKTKLRILNGCPQRKGVCTKVYTRNPKKPNSAIRKVCDLIITPSKRCIAYIPGEGHSLQKYSTVLIRGGRVRDLPGIKYKLIGGKYDFISNQNRKNRRSLYGVKKVS